MNKIPPSTEPSAFEKEYADYLVQRTHDHAILKPLVEKVFNFVEKHSELFFSSDVEIELLEFFAHHQPPLSKRASSQISESEKEKRKHLANRMHRLIKCLSELYSQSNVSEKLGVFNERFAEIEKFVSA